MRRVSMYPPRPAPHFGERGEARRRPVEPLAKRVPPLTGEQRRLAEEHHSIVENVARTMRMRLPDFVEMDDLISAGNQGLMDAARKFDPQRGIQFRTLAETRVRGAILDSLRDADFVPRDVRHQLRKVRPFFRDEAYSRSPAELAELSGVSRADIRNLLADYRASITVRFDSQGGLIRRKMVPTKRVEAEHDWEPRETLTDMAHDEEQEAFQRQESLRALVHDLFRLFEKEVRKRAILNDYFVQGMMLKDIGLKYRISETRVCQIKQAFLKRVASRHADLKSSVRYGNWEDVRELLLRLTVAK